MKAQHRRADASTILQHIPNADAHRLFRAWPRITICSCAHVSERHIIMKIYRARRRMPG
jgi:hypothetical protein